MAADASKIHIGPGDLWITSDLTAAPTLGGDLTDPTTSSVMAMLTNYTAPSTTASPSWRYVGFTNGPSTLTYRPTYYMVQTEQAFAEVVVTPTGEETTLGCTLLESGYQNLAVGIGQGTTKVVTGPPAYNAVFVGGKATTALSVVVLMSRHRSGTGYYVATLYQAYSDQGVALNFDRRSETRIGVSFRALANAARPVGDQLFQIADYAANP
jgi:hypothetical protein